MAPLGYINRAFGGVKDIVPDAERADIVAEMFRRAGHEGWSGRRLKQWLDEIEFKNRSGTSITLSRILAMLKNPFYYGEFRYPDLPDGKWYKGAHHPLISKELFELVQQSRGAYKGVWGSKQFAFRGLLKCGRCGADITAQEKFKKLKDGGYNRHVYYNCTRRVDPNCQEKYINETNLCVLLQEFVEANYKKIKVSEKLQAMIERHYGATQSILNHYKIEQKLDKPFIEYSRYVLCAGTENEKAALANGIKHRLVIKFGRLQLDKVSVQD